MAVRLAIAAASTFEGEAGGRIVSTPLEAPRTHYRRGASFERSRPSLRIEADLELTLSSGQSCGERRSEHPQLEVCIARPIAVLRPSS
jgi:hypothetical protein